jgi:hypothetical protein
MTFNVTSNFSMGNGALLSVTSGSGLLVGLDLVLGSSSTIAVDLAGSAQQVLVLLFTLSPSVTRPLSSFPDAWILTVSSC